MEPQRAQVKVAGHDLVALGLFAIAGAILGLAFAVVYIGVSMLNAFGVQWHWIWEG